jgi:cell wall-associated NlpC family hydrolase
MRARLRQLLYDQAARILTEPLGSYLRCSGQDVEELKRHVCKGDVVLVCGDQRVSEVIRYLTQSSWSHAAIYVGDELLRRSPESARELEERFGDDARHLIVEALIDEGVVASPISKYRSFHLRLCRPFGLEPVDLATVMGRVIAQIGGEYDLVNLFDLARYFLPVSLVPASLRREALEFGSGRPTEVICSSMIAQAFQDVGFPILPRTEEETAALLAAPSVEPQAREAIRSANGHGANGHGALAAGAAPIEGAPRRHYHVGIGTPSWPSRRPLARHLRLGHRPPSLITPRDFDLSPYFEIVKFSLIEGARRQAEAAAPQPARVGLARRTVEALPLWRRFRRAPEAATAELLTE